MRELNNLCQQIQDCRNCPGLVAGRNLVVPGEGPPDAGIMFIGEAPGMHEDRQGRPFVGAAGSFLTELLAAINLKREQVYITNVVKCRPPGNRDPQPDEISNCADWLTRQIAIIKPRMIVTLGRYSLARFFPGKTIGKVHGTAYRRDGITYFAMYHPAAALHQNRLRQTLLDDVARIPAMLSRADEPPPPAAAADDEEQPRQLSML
jgi:uracil-DNA glycosylase